MNTQWIDIDTMLPPMDADVIAICDAGNDGFTAPTVCRWTGRKTAGKSLVMDYGEDNDWYCCTHWFAIPPLPHPTK